MKICAALAWWQEDPAWLDRCVRSLAGAADTLLAFDGRWEGVPGAGFLSDAAEYHAIHDAAAAVGIRCEIVAPERPFESQVAKRNQLMCAAGWGHQWVLVIDGDEFVSGCDPDGLRRSLELTDRHVALVLHTNLNQSWPYNRLPTHDRKIRRLYRSGTEVRTAHNGYWRGGLWLNGDGAYVRTQPAVDLSGVLRMTHDNMNRPEERRRLAAEYRQTRKRERLEEWAHG